MSTTSSSNISHPLVRVQAEASKVRRLSDGSRTSVMSPGASVSRAARRLPHLTSHSASLTSTSSPLSSSETSRKRPASSAAASSAPETQLCGGAAVASIVVSYSRSGGAAAVLRTNAISHDDGSSSSCGSRQFAAKYAMLEPLEASSLYRCLDKERLQEYVCKVVPTQSYHDYLSGYLRMDGHPGINSIESVIVGGKQTHILFKPSHGDLHSYVRSHKRLPEAEAIRLFHQIAVIVNDCHENGICLRDLKLRKFVFRDPEKTELKLETLDDAVVLEDPDDDLLGEKHGCPVYASPEILSTINGRYSGRGADCWSLGVILYTMLVGRYPFHDTNPTHLFGKIRRGLFQIPTSISPLARVVINSLLRKDPVDRMTTEDLLASQLFSAKFMQQQQQPSLHPDCTTVTSSSRPSLASLLSRSGGHPSSSPSSILIHSPLFSLTSSSPSSSGAFSPQNN